MAKRFTNVRLFHAVSCRSIHPKRVSEADWSPSCKICYGTAWGIQNGNRAIFDFYICTKKFANVHSTRDFGRHVVDLILGAGTLSDELGRGKEYETLKDQGGKTVKALLWLPWSAESLTWILCIPSKAPALQLKIIYRTHSLQRWD